MGPLNKLIITILGYHLPGIVAGDPFLKTLRDPDVQICEWFLSFWTLLKRFSLPGMPLLPLPSLPSLAGQTPFIPQDLKQSFLPEAIVPAPPGKESSPQCSWSPQQAGTSTVTFITLGLS